MTGLKLCHGCRRVFTATKPWQVYCERRCQTRVRASKVARRRKTTVRARIVPVHA